MKGKSKAAFGPRTGVQWMRKEVTKFFKGKGKVTVSVTAAPVQCGTVVPYDRLMKF